MATTQDYIDQLKIDKQNLVSMLNNMGVEATDSETFTALAPKVGKIVTDPILQDKSIEITENGTTNIVADEGYNGLNNVSVTANVASSGGGKYAPRHISFAGYTGKELKEELSNIDFSNITSTKYMFYGCNALTGIDLSSLNSNEITDTSYMFYGCSKLKSLDISNLDTSKVTTMAGMFYNCGYLQTLDIRNFEFTNVTATTNMFNGLQVSCKIIVKDETAKAWVLNVSNALTNVKTVAEL